MPQLSDLSPNSVIRASREQISSDLAGDVVILNLQAGVYHGLEGAGAWIWRHIQQPITVTQLLAAMLAEYDVTPERCRQDLVALVAELTKNGLVEVTDGPIG